MRVHQRWISVVVVTLALWLTGCGGGLKQGVVASKSSAISAGVFLPSSTPFGKTYGEWIAAYFQLMLSIPKRDSPNFDATGEKCGIGQSGPVWFLAGGSNGVPERRCTIPADKAIFFLLRGIFSTIPIDAATEDALRLRNKRSVDNIVLVEASLDGVALEGLRNFRFQSPIFSFTSPTDPAEAVVPTYTGFHEKAIAGGYYVMLEPLPVGEHTLVIHSKAVFPSGPSTQVAERLVTYHLTVQ